MHNTSDKTENDSGPVGGERLRIARRENDISVRDIAKELHLDEEKVRALEKNQFDVLGAPVFAKGHLRKYAELVGISTDDMMSDYYQMNRSVGAPPVVGLKRRGQRDISAGVWIAAFVLVAAIAATGYWWIVRDPAPVAVDAERPIRAPSGSVSSLAVDDADPRESTQAETDPADMGPADADVPMDSTVDLQPADEQSSVGYEPAINEPPGETVRDLPQVQIELTFSGDCWTEVSDASGRRLFYNLGQAGRVVTLSGDAPLRVILGDSGNVGVKVAGNDYTIPRSAITGRLARLTLNSPR